MSIKDIEVHKKVDELVEKFRALTLTDGRLFLHETLAREHAIIAIDEVIYNLESLPKLTVCEIEGQKCYGIIDFYKEVKAKIQSING